MNGIRKQVEEKKREVSRKNERYEGSGGRIGLLPVYTQLKLSPKRQSN
jgi:hypothetical protein